MHIIGEDLVNRQKSNEFSFAVSYKIYMILGAIIFFAHLITK